jgi:hypothetical protein
MMMAAKWFNSEGDAEVIALDNSLEMHFKYLKEVFSNLHNRIL